MLSYSLGRSENNRRARYYRLAPAGRKRLIVEAENWERMAGIIARLFQAPQGKA